MHYRNPTWSAEDAIDIELEHPEYGWIPFTCTPRDNLEFGRLLYDEILASGVYIAPKPERDPIEELQESREGTQVTAFQAKAMLLQAGYWEDVSAHLADADPVTQLAWETAQEFERLSPTILELAGALGISDTELDDLFKFAATIKA